MCALTQGWVTVMSRWWSLPAVGLALALVACCSGTLGPGPPADPCFEGEYRWCPVDGCGRALWLLADHWQGRSCEGEPGQVSISGYWIVPPGSRVESPWESLTFVGSVSEVGHARGTLTLDFGADEAGERITWQISDQEVILADGCSERAELLFSYEYPDLTEPDCRLVPEWPDCRRSDEWRALKVLR